jgi:hypothetical protein
MMSATVPVPCRLTRNSISPDRASVYFAPCTMKQATWIFSNHILYYYDQHGDEMDVVCDGEQAWGLGANKHGNSVKIINLLYRGGYDIDPYIVRYAAYFGQVDVIRAMAKVVGILPTDLSTYGADNDCPLCMACEVPASFETVKMLIDEYGMMTSHCPRCQPPGVPRNERRGSRGDVR